MNTTSMPKYKDTISLIPYGLPQFLDFEASSEEIRKITMDFAEKQDEGFDNEESKQVRLYQVEKDEDDGAYNPETKEYLEEGEFCSVSSDKHLGPFMDRWVPIPFFRESDNRHEDGEPVYLAGPTNWARAYLTRLDLNDPKLDNKNKFNWRLVLCFDMQVIEDDKNHCALNQTDVGENALCSLAYLKRDNASFLMQLWVNEWLKSLWDVYFDKKEHLKDLPRCAVDNDDYDEDEKPDPHRGELHLGHLASYLVYLKLLHKIIGKKKVRISRVDENQEKGNFVDVDLVLDIGNSRSTGIIVEHVAESSREAALLDSYRLQLRDMTKPYIMYSEPFETRLEFTKTEFGLSEYSDRSERAAAFCFASPVRTGPEATRLAGLSVNAEGASGMSSPKRYLWDLEQGDLWFFNKSLTNDNEELVSSLDLCRYVNNTGIPLSSLKKIIQKDNKKPGEQKEKGEAVEPSSKPSLSSIASSLQSIFGKKNIMNESTRFAIEPRFARSSMMMFLFMELIQQALITINSPAVRETRKYTDRPRRLANIIFTVPPGMPNVEKSIYNTWGRAAVEVMWDILGWKDFYQEYPDYSQQTQKTKKRELLKPINNFRCNPDVKCEWDEATCSQLVYIYNEIKHNFAYDAQLFFESMGKRRKKLSLALKDDLENKDPYSLRVATIDIGGGTTDLSVTSFVLANSGASTNRIIPKQEITDGFNVGGDNVLQSIVTKVVLKKIAETILKDKPDISGREDVFRGLFGQKSIDMRVQNLKVQFIRQVAMPIAYAILSMYEKKDLHDEGFISVDIGSLFKGKHTDKKMNQNEQDDQYKDPQHQSIAPNEAPNEEVLKFFADEIKERFSIDVNVLDLTLIIPHSAIDKEILSVLGHTLDSMGELIYAYDCDVLILTGRPSCWNAIIRHIYEMVSINPNRVIPMRRYKVGSWYRFADENGIIEDPKTTVVMGAVLCQLAENSLEGFVFNSSRLKLKDTARFIGELDNQGTLTHEKVWFINDGKGPIESKTVDFSAPISIGFRQLEADRWTATKCWYMDFASEEARRESVGRTPYKVTVSFVMPEDNDKDPDKVWNQYYQPVIKSETEDCAIKDRNGSSDFQVKNPVKIKLSTLSRIEEQGCWMDTGVLYN